jgi:hypothetical protein
MSPKEKVKDLISSFTIINDVNNNLAKNCAKIAVAEIMQAIGWDDMKPENRDNYWDDVLYEINKF